MSNPPYPTEENPAEGPTCPDCGGQTDRWRNQLSDDEYTTSIACRDCDFGLESESNLAYRDRRNRVTDHAY